MRGTDADRSAEFIPEADRPSVADLTGVQHLPQVSSRKSRGIPHFYVVGVLVVCSHCSLLYQMSHRGLGKVA